MKAYFTGALYQKEKFLDKYKRIIITLKKVGYEVMEDTVEVSLEDALEKTDAERVEYYKKVLKWVDKSDIIVAEASFPSTLSIGHEITLAAEKSKPVIVLYMEGFEPTFLMGLKSDKIVWVKYTEKDLENVLEDAVEKARGQTDVRFNFFVSPKILSYLDWVAKNKMIPRSVFLRDLIEKEMKKDKGFRG